MTKQKKFEDKGEANYFGYGLMERNFSQPHLFAQKLAQVIESGNFGGIIKESQNQTQDLVGKLTTVALEQDFHLISPFLPEIADEVLASRAVKQLLSNLREKDENNPFGSTWNEWTAKIAIKQIGTEVKTLSNFLDKNNPVAQQTRVKQAQVSKEVEILMKRQLTQAMSDNIRKTILIETWLVSQIEELRKKFKNSEFSKSHKEQIIFNTLKATIRILSFAEDQKVDPTEIKNLLFESLVA